jgi:hypothetical protein
MSAARVILITVAGPGGHVDVGIRSDATPEDLAEALGGVIGVNRATSVIEHRSPPRPGVPDGGRALVRPGTVLADAGVADGDLVLFRAAGGAGSFSWPEVQGRPAEFGDGSPPPDTPAFSLPAPTAPALPSPSPEAPAAAAAEATFSPPPPDTPAAGAAEPTAGPPPPEAPASAGPASPQPAAPDIWPPAEPVASDIWPLAEPAADPGPASAKPDSAEPALGMRLVRAPRPPVGRHARDRTSPADPDPDTTEIWPAVTIQPADTTDPADSADQADQADQADTTDQAATTGAAGPSQLWRQDSQEGNPDDWRG